MQNKQFHSHLNGYEYILVHKPHIWADVEQMVFSINAENCRIHLLIGEQRQEQLLYSPTALVQQYETELSSRNWHTISTPHDAAAPMAQRERSTIPDRSATILTDLRIQTTFIKERIAIELFPGEPSRSPYELFAKHMALYMSDLIDVGIEILPVKELQSQMSSGIGYYEGELYNLIRQGRGIPAVPLVIIGVGP